MKNTFINRFKISKGNFELSIAVVENLLDKTTRSVVN